MLSALLLLINQVPEILSATSSLLEQQNNQSNFIEIVPCKNKDGMQLGCSTRIFISRKSGNDWNILAVSTNSKLDQIYKILVAFFVVQQQISKALNGISPILYVSLLLRNGWFPYSPKSFQLRTQWTGLILKSQPIWSQVLLKEFNLFLRIATYSINI